MRYKSIIATLAMSAACLMAGAHRHLTLRQSPQMLETP